MLTRLRGAPEWTDVEATTALDIGHDLGRAILNARTFEREHQLVEELQALDTYKSQLIATVSHELKNPLTSIMGHLEMLESRPDVAGTDPQLAGRDGPRRAAAGPGGRGPAAALARSATRTTRSSPPRSTCTGSSTTSST